MEERVEGVEEVEGVEGVEGAEGTGETEEAEEAAETEARLGRWVNIQKRNAIYAFSNTKYDDAVCEDEWSSHRMRHSALYALTNC